MINIDTARSLSFGFQEQYIKENLDKIKCDIENSIRSNASLGFRCAYVSGHQTRLDLLKDEIMRWLHQNNFDTSYSYITNAITISW